MYLVDERLLGFGWKRADNPEASSLIHPKGGGTQVGRTRKAGRVLVAGRRT